MAYSEDELRVILDEMRAGVRVVMGGSRCHTTIFFRDGGWFVEDFDEGATDERAIDERGVRYTIESSPDEFRDILRRPPWRRFSAAFRSGDRALARSRLAETLLLGDPFQRAVVLDAVLAWPGSAPSPEARAIIEDKVLGHTAYHVLMDAVEWQESAETGRLGVAFMDALGEMIGDSPRLREQRRAFEEMLSMVP